MIEGLNPSVITLLALINPVICGVMLLQLTPGASHRQRLTQAANVLLRTVVILLISATIGYGIVAPGPDPAVPTARLWRAEQDVGIA